jgi:hypothetical protein
MVAYGQPRRVNVVTLTLLGLLLAGGYWMWRFFPVYFEAWTVDHVLKELASAMYRANRLNEPERSKTMKALVDKARADIVRQANVTDPDLTVNLEIDDTSATVSADYSAVVTHPAIARTTTITFHRQETANIKPVVWE